HPNNGEKPTFKTEAYSFYDKKNIYFAFRCFDDEPAKISADITPFGEYENNDEIKVYIDTFLDKRTYKEFAVNPRGVKDGEKTVWDAAARITGHGWDVEIKIPFKSLRFPVKDIQQWSVNFRRDIFRLNETSYWTKFERDRRNTFGDTFGKLEGIRKIKGGKNIEVFPYAGYRNSVSGDEKDDKFAYGLDLKYGITSNLTLDFTSSPDYSEVESDP
ncbi:MAG: carbohydrate binding family 9 domain-containing protein, partial [bacterium]|nr:carbohydrate binding family 9 domain-containing protein [bacterium]